MKILFDLLIKLKRDLINKIITLKSYLKQDDVAPHVPPHNIILFELDFNVKFNLLRILQFLSDLSDFVIIM